MEGNGEDTVNVVNSSVCSYAQCGKPATRICPECGQDFCEAHQCLVHSKTLDTQRESIVDEDGVTKRNSARIRLIGEGWPDRLRMVDDMTDDELTQHLKQMQEILAEATRLGDYARISIAHDEYVLGYREHSRYVAAVKRREKRAAQTQGILNLGKNKVGHIPADLASLMKAYSLSLEEAKAMKILLGGAKKP